MKSSGTIIAIAMTMLLGGFPAAAHSFSTLFVVPLTGPEAESGRQAHDGFLFATRERDGHPDETSDGHLGGLDVHVLAIDSADGSAPNMERSLALIDKGKADIVTGFNRAELAQALLRPVNGINPVAIVPSIPPPQDTETMSGQSFSRAFETLFGYAPTPSALAGYDAARRIDRAVRATGGDFSKTQAFNAALRQSGARR